MTDHFSFRWGITLFDDKHTEIPNLILQYYHKVPWSIETDKGIKSGVGLTNTEMMFIIHLACFKHESPNGEARPSLTGTLKKRMGYKSNQGIINVMQGLIDKGLLIVGKRDGKTSIYDFTPFSKQILRSALQDIPGLASNLLEFDDYPKVPLNPSTKLDGSKNEVGSDPSTKLDPLSSTKLDGSRQQNLTQRIKEEKESKRKKEGLQKPPPPIAVQVYRSVAERFPKKATWPLIVKAVGEIQENLDFWEDVIRHYIACGWNPTNIVGMLEYFNRGEIPSMNGGKTNGQARTGKGKSKPNGKTGGTKGTNLTDSYLANNADNIARKLDALHRS